MSATLFAVYDEHTQEIDRVYEAQRDAQTCCDERNALLTADRWVIEPVPADEWAAELVWWAA
jgi:hypothetical protein